MAKKKSSSASKKPAGGPSKNAAAQGKGAAKKPAPQPAAKGGIKPAYIVAAVGVVVLIAIVVIGGNGQKKAANTAPPEEAKYMGRFLPSGYAEPKVSSVQVYTSDIPMSPVTPETGAKGPSIKVADLTSKKNVVFDYTRADGQTVPVMAYVKPSGKLFAAVSFCPPCQGRGQTIAADGTLTCDTCGTKRNLESMVGLSGACKLYPLDEVPVTVSGDKITFDKAVLDSWTPQPKDRPIG